jgi:TolB protein
MDRDMRPLLGHCVRLALLALGCIAGCKGDTATTAGTAGAARTASGDSAGSAASAGGSAGEADEAAVAIPAAERQRIPGLIAFVSERGPDKDVWLVRPTGEETRLTQGPEDEFPAAVRPGGAALLVAASQEEHGGVHREQLRLVALDGTTTALHAPRGRARNPSWVPDGAWFVAESDAHGFSDLVRMTPQPDSDAVRLQTAAEGSFEPSVSPDGTQVAFVSSRDGDPEIYVMKADGTDVRRLTFFHKEDWAPQWSPDGRFIAFLSNRESRTRVFVMRPDGTETRAVSGTVDTGEERDVAWSPDGSALAFVGRQPSGKTRIWKAAMDGSPPVALTGGKHIDDQPVWSPDGKYLVHASDRTRDVDLFLVRADGSGHTRLTQAPGADWLPRWLPSPIQAPAQPAQP